MTRRLSKKRLGIAVVILVVVIIGLVIGFSGDDNDVEAAPLKIGVMIPLSGQLGNYGEAARKSILLAHEELGANIELIIEDTKCDSKEALTSISKLININGVKAIVGPFCSSETLPSAPIANQNKIPIISPAATSPEITNAGDYVFRTAPSDLFQGKFGAELVFDRGLKKAAMLYSNEEYGVAITRVFKEEFEKLGGQIVADESFLPEEKDLKTQLIKIKSSDADAIYIASAATETTAISLKQMKELGMTVALFGTETLNGPDTLEAGDAAEGLIITSVNPGTDNFADRYRAKYNEEPGVFTPHTYDAYRAIAIAIKSGATTGEEIKNKLYTIEFDGESGHIAFDENGEVSSDYQLLQVKNGKIVPLS